MTDSELDEITEALDGADPLEDEIAMSLDDLETLRELEAWRPGYLWCPDTLSLVCPTGMGTYVERSDDDLTTMLVTLNEGRRVWAIAQREEANVENDTARSKKATTYLNYIKQASSASRIRGVASLFKSTHAIGSDRLNTQPDVLGTPEGILDMDTGDLYADIEDIKTVEEWGITKQTRANAGDKYDYDDRWDEFISQIMCGDEERAAYLQRALGYSILGTNPEECMFVAYGPTTRNGKGTLLNSIAHAIGDYAQAGPPDFLLARRAVSSGPDEALASLVGKRFVTMSEPEEGKRLDEAKVKTLTGNDPQSTSKKYGHQFEFTPHFTMWMSCNRLPQVSDTSVFTSGRIRVIPFEAHFEGKGQDTSLKRRFEEPRGMATILTWLIEGFIEYRRMGLAEPASVREATLRYASTGGSSIRRFVDTQCELGSGHEVITTDLHDAFKLWCEDEDAEVLSAQKVRKELETLAIGYRRTKEHRFYVGLRLSDEMSTKLERWRKRVTNTSSKVTKPKTARGRRSKSRVKLA